MSYAPYDLVTPRQHDFRREAQIRELQAQTRAQENTDGRPTNWTRRAWRFIVDRPLV
jgi:hypothetical protein